MNSKTTEAVKELKKAKNAVILAHTYQPGEVQDIADYVGDSYGLSVEASRTDADIIIFCGVRFMAETAHILNPNRKVILPAPAAGCPMADMIDTSGLSALKAQHPDKLVMCYVNSTAQIKALSDICCTSSNALAIAKSLPEDTEIIFVPDRHLGTFIQEQTGRKMIFWDGCCPIHAQIEPFMIEQARKKHPNAPILIHPEAPAESRILCDYALSTGGMCDFAAKSNENEFIIATELGLIHTLQKANPGKKFYPLSDKLVCPDMKAISAELVLAALEGSAGEEITLDKNLCLQARRSLDRMLEFSK
ncbi:MAG: quinolinate synthase NadA [Chitinispirillales bacterium]|jgi:quinolinate synthase|nr:quinolinate synthase NadA [Chitinispirillales bacterium]